jgi:hypothetical protein
MHPCRSLLLFLTVAALTLNAAQPSPAVESVEQKTSEGVWGSALRGLKTVVGGAGAVAKTASGAVGKVFNFSGPEKSKGLRLEVACSSNPVRLSQSASLSVRLQLFNTGKKTQLLEFENAHRAEVVLRDAFGKIASRASISSSGESGMVTINSGERVEFLLQLPTKQLEVGKVYTLEAAISGQAGLLAKLPLRVAS